jgi:hypothetical protein
MPQKNILSVYLINYFLEKMAFSAIFTSISKRKHLFINERLQRPPWLVGLPLSYWLPAESHLTPSRTLTSFFIAARIRVKGIIYFITANVQIKGVYLCKSA